MIGCGAAGIFGRYLGGKGAGALTTGLWFILYILIYECRLSNYLFGVRKLNNVGDSISEIWNPVLRNHKFLHGNYSLRNTRRSTEFLNGHEILSTKTP